MTNNSFFNESTETSLVKAEIVAKYFWAWAKVIIPQAKKRKTNIAYIDFFLGQVVIKMVQNLHHY